MKKKNKKILVCSESCVCVTVLLSEMMSYCPEILELTMVIAREPSTIVHRRCGKRVRQNNGNCLTRDGTSSLLCREQKDFRLVKIDGRQMYQEVSVGCGCIDDSKRASHGR